MKTTLKICLSALAAIVLTSCNIKDDGYIETIRRPETETPSTVDPWQPDEPNETEIGK